MKQHVCEGKLGKDGYYHCIHCGKFTSNKSVIELTTTNCKQDTTQDRASVWCVMAEMLRENAMRLDNSEYGGDFYICEAVSLENDAADLLDDTIDTIRRVCKMVEDGKSSNEIATSIKDKLELLASKLG